MKRLKMETTLFLGEEIQKKSYATSLIPEEIPVENPCINLYPSLTYQVIEGFGAALTEAAGYALSQLSQDKQEEVIKAFFGKEGLGLRFARIHMDSSDFCLGGYCAISEERDLEKNPQCREDFSDFDLSRDAKYCQRLLRLAMKEAGELPLLLSPWSPPAYMKDTKSRNGGGHLREDCYEAYAHYIVKYIKSYQALGFSIEDLTIQNEPLAVQTWDSCQYTSQEEKTFLRDFLSPALKEAGLSHLGIFIWDHNKERVYERAMEILDESTAPLIKGVAFHWYSGDHFDTLQMVRDAFPDLKLIHSEGCVELTLPNQPSGTWSDQAKRYAHDMIGDLSHGMNRWYDWNLVLDKQGGPNHVGNYCSAPIHCDGETDSYQVTPIYETIGHFSRYLQPGAKRIAASSFSRDVEVLGALNPDGSVILVALNLGRSLWCHLRVQGRTTRVFLPENSLSSIRMEE